MKKEDAYIVLYDSIKNDKISIHPDFLKDFKKVLKRVNGKVNVFLEIFRKQIDYIIKLSPYELSQADSNEILKYCKEFECYSLHFKSSTFNVRILGTYINDIFVFLVIFNEETGKRKTDYSNYIEIAAKRLKVISEEDLYD